MNKCWCPIVHCDNLKSKLINKIKTFYCSSAETCEESKKYEEYYKKLTNNKK